ncbi:MAG: site-2 protease family protein [Candidatus Helarchaeota archaeon]
MYGPDFSFDFSAMRKIISDYFYILDEKIHPQNYVPIYLIKKDVKNEKNIEEVFIELNEEFKELQLIPFLRNFDIKLNEVFDLDANEDKNEIFILTIVPRNIEVGKSRSIWFHILLFTLTFFSVIFASWVFITINDAVYGGFDPFFKNMPIILLILFYGISILAILGLHEIGHLIACRRHGIDASFPYFIPLPIPPLGTMGAVIHQKSPTKNKNELFDVGLSGPLVGFFVSLIVIIIGLILTQPINTNDYITQIINHSQRLKPIWFFSFLESIGLLNLPTTSAQAVDSLYVSLNGPNYFPYMLLIYILQFLFFPTFNPTNSLYTGTSQQLLLPNQILIMHPIAFAGYVGLLLTALNMMTVGQLDGGHVLRAVLGDKKVKIGDKYIEIYKIIGLIALGFLVFINFLFAIIAIALSKGLNHPGSQNDVTPLNKSRKKAFIGFIIIFILSVPIGSMFLGGLC